MKISEVTVQSVADYLKLETGEYQSAEIQMVINAAKAFIKSYTGLDELNMDEHADFIPVLYILCQDMYDNRSCYVEKSNLNKIVDTILGMHCVNLL